MLLLLFSGCLELLVGLRIVLLRRFRPRSGCILLVLSMVLVGWCLSVGVLEAISIAPLLR